MTCDADSSELDRLAKEDSRARVRADVGWNWPNLLRRAHWLNLLTKEYCSCWSMLSFDGYRAGAKLRPIGMLIIVPRLESTVEAEQRPRMFTWYLADAPGELYATWEVAPLRNVATGLLDTALQLASHHGQDGEMLLHAAPSGGSRLLRFYSRTCGMTCVSKSSTRISLSRSSDGRYLICKKAQSRAFCQSFNDYR